MKVRPTWLGRIAQTFCQNVWSATVAARRPKASVMPKPAAAPGSKIDRSAALLASMVENTVSAPPSIMPNTATTTMAAGTVIIQVLIVPVMTLVHRPPK